MQIPISASSSRCCEKINVPVKSQFPRILECCVIENRGLFDSKSDMGTPRREVINKETIENNFTAIVA